MEVEAVNSIGAKEGDRVLISIKSGFGLKISFFVYLVPAVVLVVSAVFGMEIGSTLFKDPEAFALLFSIAMFLISFGIILLYGRRLKRDSNYMPEIKKIL